MHQIRLDLEKKIKIVGNTEKKDLLVSFRVDERFRADLLEMAHTKGTDLANLVSTYCINGYTEDLKELLLIKQSGRKSLADLLG